MTDPIGDMLARIKNGYAVQKRQIKVPYSIIKEKLTQILVKEGYLKEVIVEGKEPQEKQLVIKLKYHRQKPALSHIERVSKPSLRIYLQAKELKPFRAGFGLRIISTPQGLMTDREAKRKNIGGEVVCQLW